MRETIPISAETLFDLIKNGVSEFYADYKTYVITVGEENSYSEADEDDIKYHLTIEKSVVIKLLMNRSFTNEDFNLIAVV